jgi:2-dehydropantoate 2-reductase
MTTIIIGAGSMGCLIGAKFALVGEKVAAFVSPRNKKVFQNQPLRFTPINGSSILIPDFQILDNLSEAQRLMRQDPDTLCVITVKAFNLSLICAEYKKILESIPAIILLQNGIGNEIILEEKYPKKAIFRIITSNGAFMIEPGHVCHTGEGPTIICPMNAECSNQEKIKDHLVNILTLSGFNPQISSNPDEVIWRKAFINIGINAFGALTGLTNGKLLDIPGLVDIMHKTVKEAIEVAHTKGIQLNSNFNYEQAVFDVVEHTRNNKNSMLQDLLNERSTEIDFLNGMIVHYAKELGIMTPLNNLLTVLIKGKEQSIQQK